MPIRLNGPDNINVSQATTSTQPPLPNTSRKCSRTNRTLSIVAVITLIAVTILVFVQNSTTPGTEKPLRDIANDPRLELYQSPDNAEYCPDWPLTEDSSGPHSSLVSFELPGTFDLLFFLSRGLPSGDINIDKSHSYSSSDVIEVNVTAQYYKRDDLETTKACRTGKNSKNEHGVLIWAPPRHPHHDHMGHFVTFNISVALPQSRRQYNDLSTDLSFFSHHIGDFFDIWSPTVFRDIRLKSSQAPINHGGLMGESAFIQNSDAEVQGFFAGSKQLNVQTSNSRIKTVAMMFPQALGAETEVHIQTSNAPVEAFLSMMSDYPEPKLAASIYTTNAPLNVSLPRHTSGTNSSFSLDASTSNGAVLMALNEDYEGTYDLETSWAKVLLKESGAAVDPSGKGRKRTIERKSSGRHARGSVFWSFNGEPSEEGKKRGSIKVKTSSQPITVYL